MLINIVQYSNGPHNLHSINFKASLKNGKNNYFSIVVEQSDYCLMFPESTRQKQIGHYGFFCPSFYKKGHFVL